MTVVNALVVSGGGYQGLALIKALRGCTDTRIVVIDCHAENVSRYFADAFVQAPLLDDERAFVDFALALCERENITAIFASTHYELELLSRNREAFEVLGATVFVSGQAVLTLGADKLKLHEWLDREGLPHLPGYLHPLPQTVPFPLFGKPRRGWGGQGTRVIESREAYVSLQADLRDDFLWQPLLERFDEYSVDFSVDRCGRASPLAIRRRIRSLGGFAILCEPIDTPGLNDLAQKAVDRLVALGAKGPINLQILRAENDYWISDLNPRVGTSSPLSLVAGQNSIAFLLNSSPASRSKIGPFRRTLRTLEEHAVPSLDMGQIRGVVFDLDDTLVDQKTWIVRKLDLTWQAEQHQLPERQLFLGMALQIVEEGNRSHLFDALCAELGLAEAVRTQLIETYRKVAPDQCEVYGDVLPCLDQLRRLGYALGLVTDNPPASQRQKLARSGISNYIAAVVLTGEIGVQKPDRKAFDEIARRIQLKPDELVMVGDNLFRDIAGALQQGFSHAFLTQRPGTFFNFNPALAEGCVEPARYTVIHTLTELLWHLPGTLPRSG